MVPLVFRLLCALPVALALLVTPAAATTFIDFTSSGANGLRHEESAGVSTLRRNMVGGGALSFREWRPDEMAPPILQNLSGDLHFNLVKGPGDPYYAGLLYFRYGGGSLIGPGYDLDAGDVIFTANIVNGVLDGQTFTASWDLPPGGSEVSSVLFPPQHFSGPIVLTMNLPGATPTGDFLSSFTGSVTSAIPEPATWAFMITGFGLTGAVLRRRRTAVA